MLENDDWESDFDDSYAIVSFTAVGVVMMFVFVFLV